MAVAIGIGCATAQNYPVRPIRLMVGFGPGGAADIPARFVAQHLQPLLGQPIVIENRPGGAGLLALNDMLSQPRDGYTLQLCTYFDALNTILRKNASYKLGDLAPVTMIAKYYYLLTLAKSFPAEDFDEFIRYAKTHPGEILYGQVGAGSAQELVAHQLEKTAGIKMIGVPFKGSGSLTEEQLAGRIQFQVAPPISVRPYYQSGDLKVIAGTGTERVPDTPGVPTLIERGIDVTTFGWLGICAGAGTPRPIIDLLNRDIVSIVQSEEYRAFMEKSGDIAVATSPEEFSRVLVETVDRAAPYIREFHMQIE